MLKIHRGKNVLLTDQTLALVDHICRSQLVRMEHADPGWGRLLAHLAEVGPSEVTDVQTELGLKPRELKAIRHPLERCGALVSREVVKAAAGGGHLHTAELARWDQVYAGPGAQRGGIADLIVAGVRAAVVAPGATRQGRTGC